MNPKSNAATAFGALLRENKEAAEFYDSCSATQREAILMQLEQVPDMNEFVRNLPSAAL